MSTRSSGPEQPPPFGRGGKLAWSDRYPAAADTVRQYGLEVHDDRLVPAAEETRGRNHDGQRRRQTLEPRIEILNSPYIGSLDRPQITSPVAHIA